MSARWVIVEAGIHGDATEFHMRATDAGEVSAHKGALDKSSCEGWPLPRSRALICWDFSLAQTRLVRPHEGTGPVRAMRLNHLLGLNALTFLSICLLSCATKSLPAPKSRPATRLTMCAECSASPLNPRRSAASPAARVTASEKLRDLGLFR